MDGFQGQPDAETPQSHVVVAAPVVAGLHQRGLINAMQGLQRGRWGQRLGCRLGEPLPRVP